MTYEHLWKKYKNENNVTAKKKLIENYVHLVKIVAGRLYNYYGGNVEFDDLQGYGVFGLIDAVEKFEINRGIKFETYAQIRIRGAIIDSLRKIDWIPRSLRKKSKEIEQIVGKLENKLDREITVNDISKELDMSEREVESILAQISTFNVISLDELIYSKGDYYGRDEETPESVYQEQEIYDLLRETIDSLPENEKLVISMYYFDELNYKEIGQVLDLSESRISQIHSKAIIKLKKTLNSI